MENPSVTSHSKMVHYLVNRYAENLTKYDVQTLFKYLKENKGSLAAATKEIDIQRKTVYDWDSNTNEVKLATKLKVLESSLNVDLDRTMKFLVQKNAIGYKDITLRYANMLFQNIMKNNNKTQTRGLILSFEKHLKSNPNLISTNKTLQIDAMLKQVNQKAESLGIRGITVDFDLMPKELIYQKFILFIDVISEKKLPKNQMSKELGLPEHFVDNACKAFGYIDPTTEPSMEIRDNYNNKFDHMLKKKPSHEKDFYYISALK